MKTPKRRPALASRDMILQEAEHLIHLRGFQCTSLDDIAARCKMTKANLLHHFKSKEALGLAVLDYKISAYRRCCLDSMFSEGADPIKSVRQLFDWAGRFQQDNGCRAGCFVGNIALEMSDFNERFREKAKAFFQEWTNRIGGALKKSQEAGKFKQQMDCEATAEAILSLYEGAVMLARTRRDWQLLNRSGQIAVNMLRSYATVELDLESKRLTKRG